ncbi:class I SAM-dependent methyltransferase [Dyella tabacisoli]|uniref:Class I SAM-dependent methyltransferase n=1 Tax=Dyella tabacisoli TaxID=2282381 RepID=A0A369UQ80_9GAMM|nr:class I SAM-dependent methyltransferase [Dyella tabacisoli]RDD82483.1 class I SAM-dependent methyltransferase [Dyella tabacisoli]
MTDGSSGLRRQLRQWLAPISATPLHPQWQAARCGRRRNAWIEERAFGLVLDIGCADGQIRQGLRNIEGYIGLDYPITTKLYGTRPNIFGDAKALAFAENSFDTVLLLDVVEHLSQPEAALREACRVLKFSGRLLLTIPFAYPLHDQPHDFQRFTVHGLEYRLREAGFETAVIVEATDGIDATAGCLSMTLAQGAIDAISSRGWRMVMVPIAIALIPIVNLLGWLLSKLLPARNMMPAAYYVVAHRRGIP